MQVVLDASRVGPVIEQCAGIGVEGIHGHGRLIRPRRLRLHIVDAHKVLVGRLLIPFGSIAREDHADSNRLPVVAQ